MARFRIRVVVRKNGERLPTVLLGDQVEPLSAIYMAVRLRPKSGSYNSVITPLLGVVALLNFCRDADIRPFERITSARFLLEFEWRHFIGVLSRTGGAATVTRRASDALKFLAFWARYWAATIPDTAMNQHYLALGREALRGLAAWLPNDPKTESSRDAISLTACQRLVQILRDDTEMTALWHDEWVRNRNGLLIWWLLLCGHRVGEPSGVLVSDLVFTETGATVMIPRRHDNPIDPRRLQPQVKGRSRTVNLPPELISALLLRLEERLQVFPITDHVFVGKNRQPLSRSAIAKILRRLGELHPELAGLTPHRFRHTWVSVARILAEEAGDQSTAASLAMAKALGWSNPSSNRLYGHAQLQSSADAAMMRVQRTLFAGLGSRTPGEGETTTGPVGPAPRPKENDRSVLKGP